MPNERKPIFFMRAIYCYPGWFATVEVLSAATKSNCKVAEHALESLPLRLDRPREHFLTWLQFRLRSAGLATTDGPSSRHSDTPPQSTYGSYGPN